MEDTDKFTTQVTRPTDPTDQYYFPVQDPANFYALLIDFLQDPDTKSWIGGKGLIEEIIGIDYNTLVQNPGYELVPSKPDYDTKYHWYNDEETEG
jgi:hypothetical protein